MGQFSCADPGNFSQVPKTSNIEKLYKDLCWRGRRVNVSPNDVLRFRSIRQVAKRIGFSENI